MGANCFKRIIKKIGGKLCFNWVQLKFFRVSGKGAFVSGGNFIFSAGGNFINISGNQRKTCGQDKKFWGQMC